MSESIRPLSRPFRMSRRSLVGGSLALAASATFAAPALIRHTAAATEVTMWSSFTGDVELGALNKIADGFNASQSDFTTKIVQVASTNESDVTKLMTAVRGGVGPDVYLFNRPFAIQRAADGVLQDLSSYVDVDELASHYVEFAFNECRWQNGLFALPFDTDARALYYRKDILTEVGADLTLFDPANGPITLAKLEEISALIDKKDDNGKYTRMGFVPWYAQGWHYNWGYNFGGSFYSADECKVTATDPGVKAGFQYMYDRASALGASNVQEFLSAVNRPDAPPAQNPFYTGSIAMMISGDWEIAGLANYAPDVEYGITYIPVPKEGDKQTSWSAGFSVVMPQGAKSPDGAVAFMKYMAGPEGQRVYTTDTSHLPTSKELLADDSLFTEQHTFFRDMLAYSRALPTTPVGAQLWDELTSAQEKVTLNSATPDDVLPEVDNRVQQQLQRYC